ncbi:SWIM zinc finger family protein [Naumannella halotolerans]|uniref:SWIM zinc finger protein n=1 Tax=Naumannella halotolerans TaxID=993414 RepID=A0A4R7J0X8_9ACTN|nr:SWIM zinc finger family protein [Naumannella halotolerans]TDT29889.1 SWIM zinc finger protein [Naumannella halotolerans]
MAWTVDRVAAAAPDSASEVAGRRLAVPAPWSATGVDGGLLWGQCRGSGRTPYQVSIDTEGPRYKCTCPSRKFPCKHALGLLFLWAQGQLGGDDGVAPPPTALRAEPAPADRSAGTEQTPEQRAAAVARAQRRTERVSAGMVELDRWLADQVRGGLARAAADPYRWAEPMAARMVDAQAPAVANWLRRLPGVIASGQGWPERLLAELSGMHLLARAWERIDDLPAELVATVRSRIGFTTAKAEVLAGEPVHDRWVAVGVRDLDEEQVSTRRVWLRGQRTRRWALVLLHSANGAPWEMPLPPGSALTADLHFYPGRPALRAVIGATAGDAEPVSGWRVAGDTAAEVGRGWAELLALDPWTRQAPVLLAGTVGFSEGRFGLTDADGVTVPLSGPEEILWQVLALMAGVPAVLFGEWSEAGLLPGSVIDGRVHPL